MLAVELIRRTGVMMRQRQIGGLMRFDAERHADQLRCHRVEAGGFGVYADQVGAAISFCSQASSWASVRMDS